MTEDFTHTGYAALLAAFAERSYRSVAFEDCRADRADLILRHDIDMSITAALPIAEIEAAAGMRAHYFFLLRSELYNLYSPASICGIHRIRDLGHQIGLHLDASLYRQDGEALDRAARSECDIFEKMTGIAVQTISFHRPAKILLGRPATIGGRIHSYQPRFFEDIAYVSDSRGGWHHGHPLALQAVQERRALQLLTHPIWWTQAAIASPVEKLDCFVDDRYAVLRRELAANCEPYRERMASEVKSETT